MFTRLTAQDYLDRLGHFEPVAPRDHPKCNIRTSHSRRECAQCPMRTSMRICTDDYISRDHQTFFWKQGMFDTHIFLVKKVFQIVLISELPGDLRLIGGCDIFGRDIVIQHNTETVRPCQLLRSALLKCLDRNRCRDIIADDHIDSHSDDLPRFDFTPCVL